MTPKNVAYFKVDDKLISKVQNDGLLQKIQTVTDLIIKLSSDDDRRHESVEELISSATLVIHTDTQFQIFNKDRIQSNANVAKRRIWTIELLKEYRNYLLKKIKSSDKDSKKESSQKNLQSTQSTSSGTTTSTSGTTTSSSGTTTSTASATVPVAPVAYTGDTQKLSTQRFPQTGPTMKIAPATDDTSKLSVPGSTNQSAATGMTEKLSQEGKTIPLSQTTVKLNDIPPGGTPYTGTTQDLSQIRYSGPSIVESKESTNRIPTIEQYRKQIGINAQSDLRAIQRGDFGSEIQDLVEKDPVTSINKLEQRNAQNIWTSFAIHESEEAALHMQDPDIAAGIERANFLKEGLKKEGLLSDELLAEKDFIDEWHPIEINRITYNNTSPLDTFKSFEEYKKAATSTHVGMMKDIEARFPNLASKYKSVFDKASKLRSSITTKLSQSAAGKAVTGSTTKLATSVATKFGFRAALQAIGSIVPGIGNIIAFIGGWIMEKVGIRLMKFLKRRSKNIAEIGAATLGLGLLMGSTAIGALGAGLLGLSLAGGGPAAMMAGITGIGSAMFGMLMTLILNILLLPFFLSIITVIASVTLILFIINTGGYITPESDPLSQTREATTFYINLQKTASPVRIRNEDASTRPITFTVRIDARELDLTNIAFENTYLIYQEPRTADPIASGIPSNASPSANPPSTITAGSSYTLTYTINLNDTFTNATVCDEFRITASAGPTTDSATATACVSVGDPAFDVTSCDLPTNQIPQAPGILYSSDRKYAFPVAPYAGTTEGDSRDGLTCHHWDDNLSTDIFPAGVPLDWDQALKAPGIHAPLIAYTSGEIVYANPVIPEPIGGRNFILHGDDGRYYYYAHSCHVFVRKGQRVTAGQVIATTDRSGSAADTAEHLHFAINRNSGTFIGGDGDVCPSTDFNAKLEGYTRCELPSQQCP